LRAKKLRHFLSIIVRVLESFGKHFWVIFVSKLVDAGATLFILAKMFHG